MKFLPRFTNGEHLYGNNDAIPFSNPRRAYLLEIILEKKRIDQNILKQSFSKHILEVF